MKLRRELLCVIALAAVSSASIPALIAQGPHAPKVHHPWDDKSLSPDQRADMVIKEMTLDEKIQLVHGTGWGALRKAIRSRRVPIWRELCAGDRPAGDSRYQHGRFGRGRAAGGEGKPLRHAAALDAGRGISWDPEGAQLYGSVIGRELRDQGYNMSIGGGVDITREPRNGRNFEYAGEDPDPGRDHGRPT